MSSSPVWFCRWVNNNVLLVTSCSFSVGCPPSFTSAWCGDLWPSPAWTPRCCPAASLCGTEAGSSPPPAASQWPAGKKNYIYPWTHRQHSKQPSAHCHVNSWTTETCEGWRVIVPPPGADVRQLQRCEQTWIFPSVVWCRPQLSPPSENDTHFCHFNSDWAESQWLAHKPIPVYL